MINRLLYAITARLPCRLIMVNGDPYLERYYVGKLFGATLYLHRFVSSDSERHLHNHPWKRGFSIMLAGAYFEEYVVDLCSSAPNGCLTETNKIEWYNSVNGNHFHRISAAEPGTWTLFGHGKRQRIRVGATSMAKGWGFIENGAFQDHPSSTDTAWWLTAPKGAEAGRVLLDRNPHKHATKD